MGKSTERDDRLARLLAEDAEHASDADRRLAAALHAMREEVREQPDPELADRHLHAMLVAAQAAAHLHPTPATDDTVATGHRRFAARVRRVLGITGVKIALAATAAAATTGGLAATDSLPRPVQAVVADLAGHVGIDLPAPDDDQRVDDGVRDVIEDSGPGGNRGVGDDPGRGRDFGERIRDGATSNVPDDAGPPSQRPGGPPEDAGQPTDRPDGRPEDPGPPGEQPGEGVPDDVGQPDQQQDGPPQQDDAGPPQQDDAGPSQQDDAGPLDGAGQPTAVPGPGSQGGRPGSG